MAQLVIGVHAKKLADGKEALEASRKEWTLEDYLDKDPQAYEKMKVENPKQADALEAGYFGDQQ